MRTARFGFRAWRLKLWAVHGMASPRRTVHLKGKASMTTPDFILKLREKAGHDLLWLVGVTACVLDARGW